MVNRISAEVLIVGGGPAGLSAAVAASAFAEVTLVDDNPYLGGQIWRAELGKIKSADATQLIDALAEEKIRVLNGTQVFATAGKNALAAGSLNGRFELGYEKLIIAAGARERFLPFPGWTLPNVFGAGGLQALVKGGLDVAGRRIIVAGTGPLLLAVADYLKKASGNVVMIAEQASAAKIRRFARSLWRAPAKMAQAAALRARLVGTPYRTDCMVLRVSSPHVSKGSASQPLIVELAEKRRSRTLETDYLACGFHLVPDLELADLLGCAIQDGHVSVDEFQRTSVEDIFCAGEPTGIAGVEASLIEGKIAGLAAAGHPNDARKHLAERSKARAFGDMLNKTFALRPELRRLADPGTFVCRCEDVSFGRLAEFNSFREAKLQTRCGMGPCQGRICGPAAEVLFGWERPGVRPPIFPVKMEQL